MNNVTQSAQETAETVQALIAADNDHLKDIPLSSIIAAGFSQQNELISTLTNLALNTDVVPQTEKQNIKDLVDRNKQLVASINVQNLFTTKDDSGMESFASGEDLITPLYPQATDNLIHSISDASCKHLNTFSGEEATGPEMDLCLERFLSLGFRIAQQANLSHKCCLTMLTRKLVKTAKLIFESWLIQNNITEDVLDLETFCHFLEKKFCLFSSVKSANLQLASLGQIKNFEYLHMVGKISRLCKLATREIKDREQKMLVANTKALECFRSTLSDPDRSFILTQDRMRQDQHKPPLTMHKAAELLAQKHADSIQHSLLSQASSSANMVLEDPHQNQTQKLSDISKPEDSNSLLEDNQQVALWTNRGRFQRGRANVRMRYPAPNHQRPSFNPRFQQRFPSHPQPQHFPARPSYPQNNSQRFPRRRGNYNRPQLNPIRGQFNPNPVRSPGLIGPERRPHITNEMVNVPDGFCKLCAKPGHRYYDRCCQFFGRSQLFPKACPNCNSGGHSKNSCLQKQQIRQAQEMDDDNDSIDNFLTNLHIGSKN